MMIGLIALALVLNLLAISCNIILYFNSKKLKKENQRQAGEILNWESYTLELRQKNLMLSLVVDELLEDIDTMKARSRRVSNNVIDLMAIEKRLN